MGDKEIELKEIQWCAQNQQGGHFSGKTKQIAEFISQNVQNLIRRDQEIRKLEIMIEVVESI